MSFQSKVNRLEEIKVKIEDILQEKTKLQTEHQKILFSTRKLRIKKVKMGYEIMCTGYRCGNKYGTTKNPDAELKDDRPQCRECGTRVEAKR